MARSSDARIKANKKYNQKCYDQINFIVRKDSRFKDMLNYASAKADKSRNQYIVDALNVQFAHDGITLDMLPPSEIVIPREKPGRKRELKEYMVYETLVADKDIEFWEESLVITTDLEKAREKLAIALRKFEGDEKAKPYIRGWKFVTYTKKEAVDKCKEMVDDVEFELDEDGNVTDIIRHLREPDYIEGLEE